MAEVFVPADRCTNGLPITFPITLGDTRGNEGNHRIKKQTLHEIYHIKKSDYLQLRSILIAETFVCDIPLQTKVFFCMVHFVNDSNVVKI